MLHTLEILVMANEAGRIDAVEQHLDRREEEAPAVLPVGDNGQPHLLLERERIENRAILDSCQLVVREILPACLEQIRRPQQAAKIVGSHLGHSSPPRIVRVDPLTSIRYEILHDR